MSGIEITNGNVLTDAMRFELGKPVDLDEWALARKRLYDTNVFRLVDIQPVPIGEAVDGVQPVKAASRCRSIRRGRFATASRLKASATLSSSRSSRARRNLGAVAELKNPNLFGRALTFGAFRHVSARSPGRDAVPGDVTPVWLAGAVEPLRLLLTRSASRRYRGRGAGDQRRPGLQRRSALAHARRSRSSTAIASSATHTFDPDPGNNDPFPLDFVSNLATLSTATLWDRRDDPLAPVKGTFSSVSIDHAASWLGSDVNNRKLLLQQYVFVPLRSSSSPRARSGARSSAPTRCCSSDRFQAGGATTVRGYSEDSLGPRGRKDCRLAAKRLVSQPGSALPDLSVVGLRVNGVVFVDAGNIAPDRNAWPGLAIGYGFGLRFDTRVGLLRGDVGFPGSDLTTSCAGNAQCAHHVGIAVRLERTVPENGARARRYAEFQYAGSHSGAKRRADETFSVRAISSARFSTRLILVVAAGARWNWIVRGSHARPSHAWGLCEWRGAIRFDPLVGGDAAAFDLFIAGLQRRSRRILFKHETDSAGPDARREPLQTRNRTDVLIITERMFQSQIAAAPASQF